jgi:hypothetical protein
MAGDTQVRHDSNNTTRMTTTLDTSYPHGLSPPSIHTLMPKTHSTHSVDPRSRMIVDGDGSETCKPVAVQGTMSLMCGRWNATSLVQRRGLFQ